MTEEIDNVSFLSQSRRDLHRELKRLDGKNGLVLKNVIISGRRTSKMSLSRGVELHCVLNQ